VFLDYEPVYLDWRLVLGPVARLKGEAGLGGVRDGRQLWSTPGIPPAGIALGTFIAAIQGSETQPLALRID